MKRFLFAGLAALVLASCGQPRMNVVDNGDALILRSGTDTILAYNYTVTPAPEGAPEVYARGGYIHPACTPSGFVFTCIQPADHLHHYGIWNPWTRIDYKGNVYDLWNLGRNLGTVRARSVEALYQGRRKCGFDAMLDHIVFAPEGEVRVISEEWKIRAYASPEDLFIWDFESVLEPLEDITIRPHRYQGLCCRGTQYWNKDNVEIVSSEGLTRDEIDATRARWIYVNGAEPNGGKGGFMFLTHPCNFNSPEPLRIWDRTQNSNIGSVFINVSPPKTQHWHLEPGNKYTLRYRVVAFDGEMTPERAEVLWKRFATRK